LKLEEELIRLDEEDLFGKQKSVSTEQSDLLQNLAYIRNMIVEANDIIEARDTILYDDAVTISKFQKMCSEDLGCILDVLQKYSK